MKLVSPLVERLQTTSGASKEVSPVEWPNEKKVPTVTGCWPDATRRRMELSMAQML